MRYVSAIFATSFLITWAMAAPLQAGFNASGGMIAAIEEPAQESNVIQVGRIWNWLSRGGSRVGNPPPSQRPRGICYHPSRGSYPC